MRLAIILALFAFPAFADPVRLELRGDWIEVRESEFPGILAVEYHNSHSMASDTAWHRLDFNGIEVMAHVMVTGPGPERFSVQAEGYMAEVDFVEVEDGYTATIRLIPAMF